MLSAGDWHTTVNPQLKPYLAKVKDHGINNSYGTLKNNFYNVNASEIHAYFFLLTARRFFIGFFGYKVLFG